MAIKLDTWAFVLAVPDLQRSAAFFRDVLGFSVLWEDADDWRLVGGSRLIAPDRAEPVSR
jgi:catechol 2,3-dioxygenase-like lactoylglutathione lyase family enzyme